MVGTMYVFCNRMFEKKVVYFHQKFASYTKTKPILLSMQLL